MHGSRRGRKERNRTREDQILRGIRHVHEKTKHGGSGVLDTPNSWPGQPRTNRSYHRAQERTEKKIEGENDTKNLMRHLHPAKAAEEDDHPIGQL